jgi:predicted transcriptional regulator
MITSTNGCTDMETVTVTVNALPVASISGVTTICNGTSTTLTASGASIYGWSSSLGNNSAITVSPSVTTTYTVTITNANGCTDMETVTVTVNALPVASINGVTTICSGNSTTLTASGGLNYNWSNNLGTSAVVSVLPAINTVYSVTVTNGNGCTDSEIVTVVVNALPVAAISGITTICNGGSTTLTGSGADIFSWSNSLGNNAAISVSPAVNTTYTVTVTNGNGCTDSETAAVVVNALPVAAISGVTTICSGNSTILAASGSGIFTWSNNLGNNAAVSVSPATTTTYTVTVTNGNGCTDSETATVVVNSLPTAIISGVMTVCDGNSTTLSASGANTYSWSNGLGNNVIVSVTPNITTTYTVTVTNGNGCTDSETATVIVNAIPTAVISGTTAICNGSSTTLTASGAGIYMWSGGLGTNAVVAVSPNTTTTYTVTVTNGSGCTDSESVTVTVNTPPIASVSGVLTICRGNSTALTASGASNYIWSDNLGSNAVITVSPATTSSYTVTITDNNGCTDTETVSVFVNTLPTASISGTTTICSGKSTTLTASGADIYNWSNNLGSSASIIVSPASSNNYTVTVTNSNGCSDTETVSVTVNQSPTAVISGITTICSGNSTTLTVSGANMYTWSNNFGNSPAINVSPGVTTVYTVTITDANSCTDVGMATVVVNPLPTAVISGATSICNGASTTLTASGASTYTWSGGLGNNIVVNVSPASATTYTVTVTNSNGCTDSETATVTVNSLPVAVISGITTVCNGTSTTLTATGAGLYAWSNSLGSNAGITVSPVTNTSYTVTVTDANGCTDSETATVSVALPPVAAIAGITTICAGNSTTLTASGAGSYTWSNGPGNNAVITVTPSATTTYTVTVSNGNGCTDTDSVTVQVNQSPLAVISGITTICRNSSTTLVASGAGVFIWSNSLGSNTSITVSPVITTTYTVTVTNGNGCTDSETATVTVNSLPTAGISGITTICSGNNTTLTASGAGVYAWSNSPGNNTTITVSPSTTTSYTVTVTDANGCTDSETATVTVNQSPTVSFIGNTTLCNGNSTTLTAGAGSAYLWSNGSTVTAITVNPVSTTTYTVTVTGTSGCTATGSTTVTVTASPVISGVSPVSGSIGTVVTIAGANFAGATQVKLNGVSCPSFTVINPAQINVTMPFGGSFTTASVINPCATANFSANALSISSFSPTSGSPGTIVTVSGLNMGGAQSVTIGGVSQLILSNTANSVTFFLMPNTPSGPVKLITGIGIFTSVGIFTVEATPFPGIQQGTKLVGLGVSLQSMQGSSVAISADGNTAAVGVPSDNTNQGAVFIFVRNAGIWTQQGGKLVGTGAFGPAKQGTSVAISADGNTVAAGAPLDNVSGGAVWVFTRTGTSWSQQGSKLRGTGATGNAQQGTAVSISADGNTIALGGIADNSFAGAAWIFVRSGGVWTQQGGKLVGTGATGSNARQGCSVALSANGRNLIVGAYNDNDRKGASWVFVRNGSTWIQQGGKLVGTGATPVAFQGYSVAISADGGTALIGAPNDATNHTGAVWIFTRNGSAWSQQGSKQVGANSTAASRQGSAVALSADGNIAVWGGFGDSTNTGAMWVYKRTGNIWEQKGSKLIGSGASGPARQGTSIALCANGHTALLGGSSDASNSGAVWVFVPGSSFMPTDANIRDQDSGDVIKQFSLDQNIPNPFTDRTNIRFTLPEACTASWRITDINGRVVLTLKRNYPAGFNTEVFDMSEYNGVYWYSLETPFGVKMKKMVVVR